MPHSIYQFVQLEVDGKPVEGLLVGDCCVWSFFSDDEAFLKLFPSGAAYSYSDFGQNVNTSKQLAFQTVLFQYALQLVKKSSLLGEVN